MSNEISLESLKERIEKNKLKSLSQTNNLSKFTLDFFIESINIAKGSTKVETYLLYEIYLDFSRTIQNPSPLSKIDFFRKFGKLFKKVRHGNQRFYLINSKEWKVSELLISRIRINERERKIKEVF